MIYKLGDQLNNHDEEPKPLVNLNKVRSKKYVYVCVHNNNYVVSCTHTHTHTVVICIHQYLAFYCAECAKLFHNTTWASLLNTGRK